MKNTKQQQRKKNQLFPNHPHKQSSLSFLAQYHPDKPINTTIDSFQINKLKKSCKKKLNLHQIKIQADSLCEQKDQETINQSYIIEQLKQNDEQCSYLEKVRTKKSQSFKRQLKIWSQNRKNMQIQVRQNCHSLFNEGFLPNVKKFYSTYKNFQRQNEKVQYLRQALTGNESRHKSFRTLKLVQNIRQQQSAPKKLGMVGSHSIDRINHNSLYLTKKQLSTLTKGLSVVDVHKIGLSNNKLSRQNARLLVKNIPQKVQKINLKNTIRSKEILLLLNSQTLKLGRLKKLNLSFNKITDTGFKCIQQVFSQNLTLQILNLSNNFITDQSANIISNFIRENQNLRNLNLAWNQFTGKNMFMIFEAIQLSKSLLNFNLSRNKIGEKLSDIIFINSNKKETRQIKDQNIKQKDYSSLKSLCRMLKNNRYLIHFDLSYNNIQNKDSESIIVYFNLFNQTMVGFHFLGNSQCCQNQFGFLTKNQNISFQTPSSQQYLVSDQKVKGIDNIRFSVNNSNENYYKETKDKCWLCLGWITKKFTFQIERKTLLILQALKNPFGDGPIQNDIIKNVYVHLQCYDYQPVLMKCKKKIKSGIINKILQGERSMRNLSQQNKHLNKPFGKRSETQKNQKTKITSMTAKNLNNSSKNQDSVGDDQEIIIYSYSINLKIPPNIKFRYFFTIDGQPIIDLKSQVQKLKFSQLAVQFSINNPFEKILLQRKQKVQIQESNKSKQIANQQTKQAFKLIQSLIVSQKSQTKQTLKLKLFLTEFNIHIPEKQPHGKQERTYLQKYLLEKVYNKLLSDNEQLTEQQYDALIKQRVRFQQLKNEGSDKYISSNKQIQTKQLQCYQQQSQESQLYLKPRFKDLFYGHSDPKLNAFDLIQFFKTLVCSLDNPKDQKLCKQLQKIIQKGNNLQNQSKFIYPLSHSKNKQNDYLNMLHFKKLIHKEKVKIDSFTGKIIKIARFSNKISGDNQNKQFNQSKHEQKDTIIEEQSKMKLSQIIPYALIMYQNSKSSVKDKTQTKNQSGIFNRLEIMSRKKTRSKSKRIKSKMYKNKMELSKKSQKLLIQTSNLEGFQKTEQQNQTQIIKKTSQDKYSSLESQKEQEKSITLDHLTQGQMVNLISIRLVQQIFPNKIEESQIKVPVKKQLSNNQDQQNFNKFVLKLQAWKNKQIQYNFQEKQILSQIAQQIKQKLQGKVKKIQDAHKSISQNSNKFNIKINKFISLESSTPQTLNFSSSLNKLKKSKRPTVDFKDKSFQFLNGQFQNPFKKQKDNPNVKITLASENLNTLDIIQNVETFFLFDNIFHDCFVELSTQYTVDFCSKKINKFLGKKQRTNVIKRQSKTSQDLIKKRTDKNLKITRNIARSTQKVQKISKTISNDETKSIFQKTNLTQNQAQTQQTKIENNIFQFITKQKQESERYFNKQQKIKFLFQQAEEKNEYSSINLNDFILRRFDYITLNLLNNLDKIKQFKCSLPGESKQILLKELQTYRSFLLNSELTCFHINFQRLLQIMQETRKIGDKLSQKYIKKLQIVNFNGIIDLIYEYLLYTVYFITKQTCFLIMSNTQILKSQPQNQNLQKLNSTFNVQKEKQQVILEKDQNAEDQVGQQNLSANEEKKHQKYSFIESMKNEPQKFRQELQKLMKNVFQDIVLTITKLHIKYDEDSKQVKQEKKQPQILEQKIQTQQNNLPQIDKVTKERKNSIFSDKSSKTVSKQKDNVSKSRRKKKNQIKIGINQTQQKVKQSPQTKSNLVIIKEKKSKTQKKRPKLSLNRVKKSQQKIN